ncbi:polysaccharide deacetylase [Stagonosporopsis vannaccii]|nr:polysaccharide deacetylase [Stagonosporopsis vannaccii]
MLFFTLLLAVTGLTSAANTVKYTNERAGSREEHRTAVADGEVGPAHRTTDGTCGAKSLGGATCFGFAHGNCCSAYGWCGFSEAHCGSGCQHGFGECLGEDPALASSYHSLSEHSSTHSGYVEPTSSYGKPIPSSSSLASSYNHPESSYHTPTSRYPQPYAEESSHTEHTWHSYDSPLSGYSKPTSGHTSASSQYPLMSSYATHAASGHYTLPMRSRSALVPSRTTLATGYDEPSLTIYSYATHTVTITRGSVTETVNRVPSPGHEPLPYSEFTESGTEWISGDE